MIQYTCIIKLVDILPKHYASLNPITCSAGVWGNFNRSSMKYARRRQHISTGERLYYNVSVITLLFINYILFTIS